MRGGCVDFSFDCFFFGALAGVCYSQLLSIPFFICCIPFLNLAIPNATGPLLFTFDVM